MYISLIIAFLMTFLWIDSLVVSSINARVNPYQKTDEDEKKDERKITPKELEKLKRKQGDKGDYMVTPCHHLFHKRCLEHWLNVKNQCPYCRQQIPPLED